jgi:hypothetical protein
MDRGALVASTATLACDWAQTRGAAERGWIGYREGNPMLGKTPSVGAVDAYFATATLVSIAAWYLLPRGWRAVTHTAIAVWQMDTIANNVAAGGTGTCR